MLVPPEVLALCERHGIAIPDNPTEPESVEFVRQLAAAAIKETLDVRREIARKSAMDSRRLSRALAQAAAVGKIIPPLLVRDERLPAATRRGPDNSIFDNVFPIQQGGRS